MLHATDSQHRTTAEGGGVCRSARCHRCGAILARVYADEGLGDPAMARRLERWAGELARLPLACASCCGLADAPVPAAPPIAPPERTGRST